MTWLHDNADAKVLWGVIGDFEGEFTVISVLVAIVVSGGFDNTVGGCHVLGTESSTIGTNELESVTDIMRRLFIS